MASKQSIKTTTNAPPDTKQPAQLQLPPPHTFDILPHLHELLARVDAYHNANLPLEDQQPLHDDSPGDLGAAYALVDQNTPQPLNPKELPTAVLDVKAKIRYALREIERLPDVERTIAEQEEEMEELEARITKQREMLHNLAGIAKQMEERLP